MINITIYRTCDGYKGFEISGHSGYSEAGSDIVCSAVSSIANSIVVGLCEVLNIPASVKIDEKKGYLKCTLPKVIDDKKGENVQTLLATMQKSLEYIQKDYKKYVKLEVKNEI